MTQRIITNAEYDGVNYRIPAFALGSRTITGVDGTLNTRVIHDALVNLISQGSLTAASAYAEGALARVLRIFAGHKISCLYSPILVHPAMPPGYYHVDKHGCVWLNESFCTERAWDSDGDRAFVYVVSKDGDALIWKYPITKEILRYKHLAVLPGFTFYNISGKDGEDKTVPESQMWSEMLTNSTPAPVGPMTNWMNAKAVEMAKAYNVGLADTILSDEDRFNAIEKGLKTLRGGFSSEGVTLPETRVSIDPGSRWLFGLKRYGDMSAVRKLPLKTVLQRMADPLPHVKLKTIKSNPSNIGGVWTLPKKLPPLEESIYQRMQDLGIATIQKLDHKVDGLKVSIPALYAINFKEGIWEKSGLAGVNRDEWLNYYWVVPPIFVQQGNSFRHITLTEVITRALADVKTTPFWPINWQDWAGNAPRANQVCRIILETLGKLGRMQLVTADGPFTEATHIATRSVVLIMDTRIPEEVVKIKNSFNNWFGNTYGYGICRLGTDAKCLSYVRLAITKLGENQPIWALPHCSPKRAGRLSSQLSQAHYQGKTNFLIVGSTGGRQEIGFQGQAFSTNAGWALAQVKGAYLSKVSGTYEEGYREHHYLTVTGQRAIAWQGASDDILEVPKILTDVGTKNLAPCLGFDITTSDGTPIHYVLPEAEANSKGALHAWQANGMATKETVQINGKAVECWVVRGVTTFRALAASEIKKPEKKIYSISGFEGYMLDLAEANANVKSTRKLSHLLKQGDQELTIIIDIAEKLIEDLSNDALQSALRKVLPHNEEVVYALLLQTLLKKLPQLPATNEDGLEEFEN